MSKNLSPTAAHPLRPVAESAPQVVSVDLDERAFLFPESRNLAQIRFVALEHGVIEMDFIYAHNESRALPCCVRLMREEAREFSQRMVDVIYRAQSQNVITESIRISITVAANGYILAIEQGGAQKTLYLSTYVIWRFCNALMRIVDTQSAVGAN